MVALAVVGRVALREWTSQELLWRQLHARQIAGMLYGGNGL